VSKFIYSTSDAPPPRVLSWMM